MSVAMSNNYYGAGAAVDQYSGAGGGTRTFVPEIWSGKLQVI